MNRNTILGTFAVSLLLILAGIVSQEEVGSINSTNPWNKQLTFPPLEASIQNQITAPKLIVSSVATETNMSQLVSASNRFGFNLFSQIQAQQESENKNIVISPNSVAIALAMMRNGTAGSTLAEINTVLGLDQLASDRLLRRKTTETARTVGENVDPSYAKLMEALTTADADVQLAIANSLWVNQDIALKEQFVNNSQNFYLAKVSNLNFADASVKHRINQWVAQNTAQKIPKIVDSVFPEDALYLINAIYFKGSWTKKFDADATTQQPFSLPPDQTKPVAMMSQTGDYRYYANEQFQAIRLPYGKKAELGMYIFLPQASSSLQHFNQQLNLDNWQEWLSQMRSQPGNIALPKFKLVYDAQLKDILRSLGIQQAFNSQQADFSPMTDSSVVIDTVKHKAVIEVNEEGTEAAGVTSIGIRITSATPETQPFQMNVDRPFFFAIRDDITETILFMGNVVDPE